MSSSGSTTGQAPQAGGELIAVYRTLPARILGWGIVASAATVGFIVIRGELALGRNPLLPLASVLFVVASSWVLLLRPAVELRSESVIQRNILRDITVPFARLQDIGYQWSLELTDTSGDMHSSWAIPKQREFSARRAFDKFGETTTRRKGRPGTTAQVVAGDVQREYQRWKLDGGRLERGASACRAWAMPAVAVLTGSLVLLVVATLLDGA